jgi:murein DD-endopeptidase MepM/ murein hydrolase activator NlpD
MKLLLLFWMSTYSLIAFEGGNGKSLLILLSSSDGLVRLNEQNITVLPHPLNAKQGFAILPIDYHTPPSIIEAEWITDEGNIPLEVEVLKIPYPAEVLVVDGAKVTPPPETLERIAQEKAEAEKIYSTYNPKRYWDKPFVRPIESITTSEYGSARTYNGVLKSYHGGVDFRAKTPLPIRASNDGVVILAKDRYYSGGTVIIDHGEGLYTCYFHLSQFDVTVGDKITRGQILGLSGATGRITGPHLHFAVMVHGIQSDPVNLLTQMNQLFDEKGTF